MLSFKIFAFLSTDGILHFMNPLLANVINLAKQAGGLVLDIYNSNFAVTFKTDKSPLTDADLAAHRCICQGLKRLTPDLPIISEELIPAVEKRQQWSRYWLIDPLDGTKEFLAKNGEFTINIALIDQHEPILGVIFVPAADACYFAVKSQGAFKQMQQNPPYQLHSRALPIATSITAIISRRHGVQEANRFLSQFTHLKLYYCGSALKFCLLAEGLADIYPRFLPTFAWDTAAGQCILEEAGGLVIDLSGKVLRYNVLASLNNAAFLAIADKNAMSTIKNFTLPP